MILLDMLHANANRVVFEKISIVRRSACCAPAVMLTYHQWCVLCYLDATYLSASSNMTILCRPGGSVTFF